MILAELELLLGEDRPSETSPRSLRFSISRPPGMVPPGSTTATVAPAPKFRAPQNDLARAALADVDFRQLQLVGIPDASSASSTRPTTKCWKFSAPAGSAWL